MIVGLTGGIGCGKSTVAKIFEILGCVIFNSDQAAKEIYFDPLVKPEILALLGPKAYASTLSLDKTFIKTAVFANAELLKRLNAIIHPAVAKQFEQFVMGQPGKIIVKETALLFEARLQQQVDKIVLVTASEELRISRVMERDQLSRQQVLDIIKSQMPETEKIKMADFIIYNNEKEFLIQQVCDILNQLHHA